MKQILTIFDVTKKGDFSECSVSKNGPSPMNDCRQELIILQSGILINLKSIFQGEIKKGESDAAKKSLKRRLGN